MRVEADRAERGARIAAAKFCSTKPVPPSHALQKSRFSITESEGLSAS